MLHLNADALISSLCCNLCLILLPAAFDETEIAEREDNEADDDVEPNPHLADLVLGEERRSGEPLSTREPGVLLIVPEEGGNAGDDRTDKSAVRHEHNLQALVDAESFGVLDLSIAIKILLIFEATN